MKNKYYKVHASNGQQLDDIVFHKEDGLIYIHMGYEELPFTVKEVRELIDKLKKCARD